MSILISDEEFTDLRGRVVELETLLKQVEAKQEVLTRPPVLQPETSISTFAPVASPSFTLSPSVQPIDVPAEEPKKVELAAPIGLTAHVEEEVVELPSADPTLTSVVESAHSLSSTEEAEDLPLTDLTSALSWNPGEDQSFDAAPTSSALPSTVVSPLTEKSTPLQSLFDWETLIGGKLALWVGALCLFLALASFLVYVGQTLPPPSIKMRVASGFVASFTLLGCALAARIRGQRWFVDGLLGTGLGVGFLSVWGGGPHFGLWSPTLSVIGFGLYAGSGIVLSARRNSQALLISSAVGGYLTPLFIHYHNAHGVAFAFSSYLLVLNAGVVSVSLVKKWREIVYGAFAATVLLCGGWALDGNIEKVRLLLWVSASLGWILFAGAACFRSFARREDTDAQDASLLICATGIYAATSQWLLGPLLHGFPGAFSVGLTLILGVLWMQTSKRRPQDELLSSCLLALACITGVLAIPLQFGQSGLVWGWMSQSVALYYVARRANSHWMRNFGRTLWGLSLLALVLDLPAMGSSIIAPFDSFSQRLLFCVAATFLALWTDEERDWKSVYAFALSCGGGIWLERVIWLSVPHLHLVASTQQLEATLLIGSSVAALWALCLWPLGSWRNEIVLRYGALLFLASGLCVVATIGLLGTAPLHGLRILAFSILAMAMACLGFWRTRIDAGEREWTREIVALSTACWIGLGITVEVASCWNNGHFRVPSSGTTGWFALCAIWSLFAAGMGGVSVWKAWPKLWTLAEVTFAVAVGTLLINSLLLPHEITPLLNARFGAFAITWIVALLAYRLDDGSERRGDLWLLAVLLLPLWVSTQELWNGVETYHAFFGKEWQRFASLGISLWWSLYAMSCLVVGVARRTQNLRIGALALGALAVCKVFLLDLAFLDGGLRVLSLGGLGAALLFISWLYSRLGRSEMSAVG